MLNKVILIGNVGKDPKFSMTQTGKGIATFFLATSQKYKDKTTGEQKQITDWHKLVIYNEKIVEFCKNYVKRGAKLYIEGQIKNKKYEGNENKFITEIVLGDYDSKLLLLEKVNETAQSFHEPKEDMPENEMFNW